MNDQKGIVTLILLITVLVLGAVLFAAFGLTPRFLWENNILPVFVTIGEIIGSLFIFVWEIFTYIIDRIGNLTALSNQ
jgi:hypothetical protein